MAHTNRPSKASALRRTLNFIAELRQVSPQLPAQTAVCLLTIASEPGITMQELAKRIGLTQSSCSRNVAVLSRWEAFDKPGLDLVETFEDPRARRRKVVYLTANGEQQVQSIVGKLDPSFKLKLHKRPEA